MGDRTSEEEDGPVSASGGLSADLAAVVVLTAVGNLAVFLPPLGGSVIRAVAGLPLLFLLPGYALVAAAVPAGDGVSRERAGGQAKSASGLGGPERLVVGVACSIAAVSVLALAVTLGPVSVAPVTILAPISALTLGATGVAALRRSRLPADERFRVPYRIWTLPGKSGRAPRVTNAALVVCVVVALGTVAFAVAAPNEGETFTEFYLLTETESGTLTAANGTIPVAADSTASLVVGVENHEGRATNYTVVVRLQQSRSGTVSDVSRDGGTDRFTLDVGAGETELRGWTLDPPTTGRLRVVFLLYRAPAPAEPSVIDAYRRVDVWVTVRG
jgi:uncharacterized membrane protein